MHLQKLPDHVSFLDRLFQAIENIGVDISDMYIDHICYRTEIYEEYETTKLFFSTLGTLLVESTIEGRLVAIYKLHTPLMYKGKEIYLLELPAPKDDNTHRTGREHVELVTSTPLEELRDTYANIPFITKNFTRPHNPDIEIEFEEGLAVKFHHHSLEDIILYETTGKPLG